MLPLDTPPKNICIVRLSALGDVTHAVPVLRAIQKNWPLTRVTWICATLVHPLLSVLDGVRFIVIDKKAGWRGYRQLRRQLAGETRTPRRRVDMLVEILINTINEHSNRPVQCAKYRHENDVRLLSTAVHIPRREIQQHNEVIQYATQSSIAHKVRKTR